MYKTGSCSGLYRRMDLMEKGMISRRTDCTPHTHTHAHTRTQRGRRIKGRLAGLCLNEL